MLDFLKVALLLVLLGVGAYNCLRYVIAKHLENKRERSRRREDRDRIHHILDKATFAYKAAKDPETQEYIVREIASKVHKTLKSADIKLADQFESTTERVAKSDSPATTAT